VAGKPRRVREENARSSVDRARSRGVVAVDRAWSVRAFARSYGKFATERRDYA
jgi:hypothetical protein